MGLLTKGAGEGQGRKRERGRGEWDWLNGKVGNDKGLRKDSLKRLTCKFYFLPI